jgi:hypothetical protein
VDVSHVEIGEGKSDQPQTKLAEYESNTEAKEEQK